MGSDPMFSYFVDDDDSTNDWSGRDFPESFTDEKKILIFIYPPKNNLHSVRRRRCSTLLLLLCMNVIFCALWTWLVLQLSPASCNIIIISLASTKETRARHVSHDIENNKQWNDERWYWNSNVEHEGSLLYFFSLIFLPLFFSSNLIIWASTSVSTRRRRRENYRFLSINNKNKVFFHYVVCVQHVRT